MIISKIQIINIKGIENKSFDLDLTPNKPNILVAPNGFGKSSFAIAFNSLKSNKIELGDNDYYNKKQTNRPELKLTLSNGTVLIADDNQNTITNDFDVFVINNQTEPKATVQSFNGYSFAKTSLEIKSTVLVQTIPQKIHFDYSPTSLKNTFGVNGNKLLNNISGVFKKSHLFHRMETEIDYSRFSLKSYNTILEDYIGQINAQAGTGTSIKKWMIDNLLTSMEELPEFNKLSNIIGSFGFSEIQDEADLFLTTWQILKVKSDLGPNFKKACKYSFFYSRKRTLYPNNFVL